MQAPEFWQLTQRELAALFQATVQRERRTLAQPMAELFALLANIFRKEGHEAYSAEDFLRAGPIATSGVRRSQSIETQMAIVGAVMRHCQERPRKG